MMPIASSQAHSQTHLHLGQFGQSHYYNSYSHAHAHAHAHDPSPARRSSCSVVRSEGAFAGTPFIKTEEVPVFPFVPTNVASMPGKRSGSDESGAPTSVKQPKAERPEEFSKQVRTKLQTSSRTGQACDRCKVRKIRCDGLPGGCSPCLQNNTECRTTDRITGRATQRGYVEGIEQQNRELQQRVRELEQRLMQAGIDVKSTNGFHDTTASNFDFNTSPASQPPPWSPTAPGYPSHTSNSLTPQQTDKNGFRGMPELHVDEISDKYLGISTGSTHLSSIKGTTLSILGMTIDIADFPSEDMDDPDDKSGVRQPLYNKSYRAFLQSAFNINPREKVQLPGQEDAFKYADWYFRVLNPYSPLLHRPTFMRLLTSWYSGDPAFQPTIAESVIIHMVFAIMCLQIAARNREHHETYQKLTDDSNKYYHYSLSRFSQLLASRTAQDIQALTLICIHLRNFPKPGASWVLTQATLSVAIELGLHRSAKKWIGDNPPSLLEVEMRKRTFWVLLSIHVTLAGKLGRPVGLRFEDFDVEIPEEIDDELLSENGLDTSRTGRCAFRIGVYALRVLPIFMDMYSTIYAVRRRPDTYMATVKSLEARLRAWRDGIPPELKNGETGQDEQEFRTFGLYLKYWELEVRLLLRHPSVAGYTDAAFRSESMTICVETSRQMLKVVRQLQMYKSLDTTWYQAAVYVLAVTTTLFAQWEKRNMLSAADLMALREEMALWLDIMCEVGNMMGSGTRLREAVRNVTEGTLGLLSRGLPNQNTFAQPSNSLEQSNPSPQQIVPTNTSTFTKPPSYNFDTNQTNGNTASVASYVPGDNLQHQQTPYPQATQYQNYSDNNNASNITYTPQSNHTFTTYSASENQEAPLLAAFAAQAGQVAPETWQRRDSQIPHASSQAWHQFANTMTHSLDQESYSANALMQLGARNMSTANGDVTHANSSMQHDIGSDSTGVMDQSQHTQWPLNLFQGS